MTQHIDTPAFLQQQFQIIDSLMPDYYDLAEKELIEEDIVQGQMILSEVAQHTRNFNDCTFESAQTRLKCAKLMRDALGACLVYTDGAHRRELAGELTIIHFGCEQPDSRNEWLRLAYRLSRECMELMQLASELERLNEC